MAGRVTVGIINHNGMGTLPACLESVLALDYPCFDILVVDNDSIDGSREWLATRHPEIKLLHLPDNRGPAGARNATLAAADTEYILHLDNDIVLEPDTLTNLMKVMGKMDRAAVCHPEIRDPADPSVHHYNGGWIHFLCVFVSRSEPPACRPEYEVFDTVSGAALLVHRTRALAVGGFDEDYFFNWEDGDFVIRCTLAGYLCLNVPSAVAHHRSRPGKRREVFYQIRNRWFFILKYYSWRTLVWTAPVMLSFELLQAGYLCRKGNGRDYLRGNLDVVRHFPRLMRKRRAFRNLKARRDRDWLAGGSFFIPRQLAPPARLKPVLKLYESMLTKYWRLVRHLC